MRWQRTVYRLIAVVSCLINPFNDTFAQSPGNSGLAISGYVRDEETHEALRSVALELIGTSGNTAAPAIVSGITGEFQFGGLNSGDFRITARHHGYESTSLEVRVGGTALVNVSLNLHRIDTAIPTGQGDSISSHQLSVPEKARDEFDKGMRLLLGDKPDYKRALACFERAIKAFPDYYEAYAEMAVAQQHLNQSEDAEKALRQSVAMSASRYPDALFLLSEMLNDEGKFSDAEGFARQCLQQDDSLWTCHLELARSLAGLKRPTEAEAVAAKAGELNPANPKTFLVLGNIHIQQRNYQAVIQDFDAYLKLDPSGPASDSVRASQAQARRALEKQPSTPPAH